MRPDWNQKVLEEACLIEYGTRVVKKKDGGTIYPVYGGGGDTFKVDLFNREDRIVVARFGVSEICVRSVKGKFFLNDSGLTVLPRAQSGLIQEFLDYQLFFLNDLIYSLCRGTAQKNLDMDLFRCIPLAIPRAVGEQQRIVAILDETFKGLAVATANAEMNLENARELFDRVLQSAIEGKLAPEGIDTSVAKNLTDLAEDKKLLPIEETEIPFEIPGAWRWCRFGSVVEFFNGDRGRNYPNKSEYVLSGIPWINTGHIRPNGSLSSESMNFISRKKFDSLGGGKIENGDLVYCLRGATIGKTAFVDPYTEGAVASSLVIIRPGTAIDRRYTYYFLTSRLGRELIKRFDNGAAQPNLAANSVAKYVTPLPPLPEQKAIVETLDTLLGDCQTLQAIYSQKLAAFAELKQAILKRAFVGTLTSKSCAAATKAVA